MTTSPYRRLEKAIAAADAGTIWQRWEYGRRLLTDPTVTTEAGNLRHGKTAELVEAAHRAGVSLSEREIRYRLEAARAYPCESQIRQAGADFGTWGALRDAQFPPIAAERGEKPYDPRSTAERVQQTVKQLALGEPDQLALFEYFPDDLFSELSTIGELRKYTAEMAEWTERQARRDAERRAYIDRLAAAVGGDESRTWQEAQAALDAADQAR